MSPRVPAVDPASVARWCAEYLGSPPAGELFKVRVPVRGHRAPAG